MATMASGPRGDRSTEARLEPSGWIVFAGILLMLDGFLSFFWGLAAVLNDQVVTVGGRGVAVWDFTAWGWAHLLLGILVASTGFALFSMRSWARWTAVVLVSLNVLLQFGIFTAFPFWSMLIIAIDVIIIYQLTARWEG